MVWKQCFEFTKHMAKHQTQFGQISPVMRVLVIHFLLAFFKQLDGLFAFSYHVQYEHVKMLIVVQLG